MNRKLITACAFCGKRKEGVTRLIAGPDGVAICNECVNVCNTILAKEIQDGTPRITMHSVMIPHSQHKPAILLYDATCRFCTASARPALRLVPRGAVRLQDANDPRLQARYGITPAAAAQAMHLVLPNGRIRKGAAAVRALLRLSRWAFPLAWAWYLPGFPWLADRGYAWVADHRYLFLGRTTPADCTSESCAIHAGRPLGARKGP